MPRVDASVFIKAPVEEVFAFVSDPTNDSQWLVGMIEVRDVVPNPEGVGTRYRWSYKLAGITLEGESTCTEYVRNEKLVVSTKGGAESDWVYSFAPEDGGTRVSLTVTYMIQVPLVGRLTERLLLRRNQREAVMSLANLKEILEA